LVFPGLYCHVQTLSQPFLQQNTAVFSPYYSALWKSGLKQMRP
jgi:hypothetical protein